MTKSFVEQYKEKAKQVKTLVPPYPLFISENPPIEKTPEQQRLQDEGDKKYLFLQDPEIQAAYARIENPAIREASKKIDKIWHDYMQQIPVKNKTLRAMAETIYHNMVKGTYYETETHQIALEKITLLPNFVKSKNTLGYYVAYINEDGFLFHQIILDKAIQKSELEKRVRVIHELTHLIDTVLVWGTKDINEEFAFDPEQQKIRNIHIETNVTLMESVLYHSIPRTLFEKDIQQIEDKRLASEVLKLYNLCKKRTTTEYHKHRIQGVYNKNKLPKNEIDIIQKEMVFDKPEVKSFSADFLEDSDFENKKPNSFVRAIKNVIGKGDLSK